MTIGKIVKTQGKHARARSYEKCAASRHRKQERYGESMLGGERIPCQGVKT